MTLDDSVILFRGGGHVVVELAADDGGAVSRGPEEELGEIEVLVVDEEACQREREEIQ